MNPVASAGRTSVDSGASAKLELVDKFCYLGDMLSVDVEADAVVEARIRIGCNNFRQLVPLLTNKDVSLIMRGSLRWYGHVLRKDDDDWVKKCMEYEVEGPRPRGRPKRTWREVVKEECQAHKLNTEDAMDRSK